MKSVSRANSLRYQEGVFKTLSAGKCSTVNAFDALC